MFYSGSRADFMSAPEEVQKLVERFDRLVYDLYDLTEEEIKIVEGEID